MQEIWKSVIGYEDKYQVSNFGRIKSRNYNHTKEEKILKLSTDNKGYLTVTLWSNDKGKTYKVHRIVADTFIPNNYNLPCVNHKDENKQNNHIKNLEWCTYSYNNTYGTRIERISVKNRKKVICLTTGEIFNSINEAGRKMNIDCGDISRCCRNKQKSAGKHPITGEKLIWKSLN